MTKLECALRQELSESLRAQRFEQRVRQPLKTSPTGAAPAMLDATPTLIDALIPCLQPCSYHLSQV
jgi:hypothetical protein